MASSPTRGQNGHGTGDKHRPKEAENWQDADHEDRNEWDRTEEGDWNVQVDLPSETLYALAYHYIKEHGSAVSLRMFVDTVEDGEEVTEALGRAVFNEIMLDAVKAKISSMPELAEPGEE